MRTFRSWTHHSSVIRNEQIIEQQRLDDTRPFLHLRTADGLTAEERGLLIERLKDPREWVGSALLTLSEDSLHRRPSQGGWTAMECAEHLVLTEDFLMQMGRTRMLGAPNSALLLEFYDYEATKGAVAAPPG